MYFTTKYAKKNQIKLIWINNEIHCIVNRFKHWNAILQMQSKQTSARLLYVADNSKKYQKR